MILSYKKISYEYLGILLMSVLSGLLISIYNLSILTLLGLILFTIISFRYFDKVLLLVIFYIPFQIALNVSSGIDLASGRVFILGLFAVWFAKSLAEKKINISFSLQTIFLCAFLFFAALSMLWAFEDERAMRKILVFLSIFPLYFLTSSFESKKYAYKVLDALFLGGFLISSIGFIQFAAQFIAGIDPVVEFWSYAIAPIFYGNEFGAEVVANPSWLVNVNGTTLLRVFSLFPDPHMFSFYAGLILPILLSLGLFYHKDFGDSESLILRSKSIIIIFILIMILSEALTFSRGGYIGMIAGIGSFIILSWKYLSGRKKFLLGSFFAIFLLIVSTTNQSFVSRLLSSFDFSEGSNSERLKNWAQGYEIFADNVFFGVGIGNYSYELKPSADYRTPIYAHNTYLDIGAEMGILALIAWLALIVITIYQLFKLGRNTGDNFTRIISLGLIGSLVWFSVHSFFDTAIYSPTVLAVFIVVISLSVLVLGDKTQKTK